MASKYGKSWASIRTEIEPQAFRHAHTKIMGWPEEAFMKYYFQFLQQLTASAADIMREYTRSNAVSTRTGRSEGRVGRYKTGEMFNGIVSNASGNRGAIKQGKGHYVFRFGWLDKKPGYAMFQEWGTSNGIVAMHAQYYTAEIIRQELKLMSVKAKAGRVIKPSKF